MPRPSMPEYNERYPAHYLSVDVVILTVENGELKALMVDWEDRPPETDLSLPGEIAFQLLPLEEIAGNHVERRLGLHGIELEQIGIGSDPGRDDRGRVISISCLGLAEARHLRTVVVARYGPPAG